MIKINGNTFAYMIIDDNGVITYMTNIEMDDFRNARADVLDNEQTTFYDLLADLRECGDCAIWRCAELNEKFTIVKLNG